MWLHDFEPFRNKYLLELFLSFSNVRCHIYIKTLQGLFNLWLKIANFQNGNSSSLDISLYFSHLLVNTRELCAHLCLLKTTRKIKPFQFSNTKVIGFQMQVLYCKAKKYIEEEFLWIRDNLNPASKITSSNDTMQS